MKFFKSDEELEPEPLKGPVIVGGRDIQLSEGMKSVLAKGPKYTIRRILSKEAFINELTKCHIKERWDQMGKEELEPEEMESPEEMGEAEMEEQKRVMEAAEMEEASTRQVFNPTDKTIRFGHLSSFLAHCKNISHLATMAQ